MLGGMTVAELNKAKDALLEFYVIIRRQGSDRRNLVVGRPSCLIDEEFDEASFLEIMGQEGFQLQRKYFKDNRCRMYVECTSDQNGRLKCKPGELIYEFIIRRDEL